MKSDAQPGAQILDLVQFRERRKAGELAVRGIATQADDAALTLTERERALPDLNASAYILTGATTVEQLLDEMRRHQQSPVC